MALLQRSCITLSLYRDRESMATAFYFDFLTFLSQKIIIKRRYEQINNYTICFRSPGQGEGSSSSVSSVGIAVGSFFGGVFVTGLVFLLLVFVKRRNKNKNRIDMLPMTVRGGTTNGQTAPRNGEVHSNRKQQKDDSNTAGQILNLCLPCTTCL